MAHAFHRSKEELLSTNLVVRMAFQKYEVVLQRGGGEEERREKRRKSRVQAVAQKRARRVRNGVEARRRGRDQRSVWREREWRRVEVEGVQEDGLKRAGMTTCQPSCQQQTKKWPMRWERRRVETGWRGSDS